MRPSDVRLSDDLNYWLKTFLTFAVAVLVCDGFAAGSGLAEDRVVVKPAHPATPSQIRTEIRRPNDHPHYALELEPHFVVQWDHLPFRTNAGVGLGFRASIPVLDPGPIPHFNNSLAVSFGVDWAHFSACRVDEPDCGGNDFWFPVVMQWNFYLTHWWSVFPEVGFAIHHAAWGWDYYVDADPGPPGPPSGPRGPGPICGPRDFCDYTDHVTEVAFVSWLGTRFSLSDRFSFTLRAGIPSLLAGVSIRM